MNNESGLDDQISISKDKLISENVLKECKQSDRMKQKGVSDIGKGIKG